MGGWLSAVSMQAHMVAVKKQIKDETNDKRSLVCLQKELYMLEEARPRRCS